MSIEFGFINKFSDRDDNLICAAVVIEEKLIVKTIMHRWQLVEPL
jgi:hypothetical protein